MSVPVLRSIKGGRLGRYWEPEPASLNLSQNLSEKRQIFATALALDHSHLGSISQIAGVSRQSLIPAMQGYIPGCGFGILYLLAMMQAASFAYDQILNNSAMETA